MARQSERQRGAFVFLWAQTFGECTALLPDECVSLGNKVVHSGKIPTRQEAVDFGNTVLDVLGPKISALDKCFSGECYKQNAKVIRERREKLGGGCRILTAAFTMILHKFIGCSPEDWPSFENHLETIDGFKRYSRETVQFSDSLGLIV